MVKDIINQARYIPRALLLALFFGIAFLFFKENGKESKKKLIVLLKQKWLAGFLFYLALILTGTVFARQHTIPYRRVFLNFGIKMGDSTWNKEILENILLFLPYTFMYLNAFSCDVPWKSALKISFFTSVFIEFSQLLFWLGFFQFADIFHNVMGGMIGCGIWYLIEWGRKRTSKDDG